MDSPQPPKPAAALEVQGLSKRYGKLAALTDLSFASPPGEVLGLVGPNGAGKTTALRCIAGILRPDHGRVQIAGHDVLLEPIEAKQRLALVPDTPEPFDFLTVEEHLRFVSLAWRVPDAEARFAPLLERFALTEKRDAMGNTLSRGMRQKLAIACAFVRDPHVVLLDEPLSGLDPRAIRDIRDAIRERADQGAAVVLSSHLLDLVERLCDRVLVLHRGRCLALGTIGELRERAAGSASFEDAFFAIVEDGPASPGETSPARVP